MAGHLNKAEGISISPKHSSLEADDGCSFYPAATVEHFGSHQLVGRGGMDVCDGAVLDSGVSLQSFVCDGEPSLGFFEPAKPQPNDLQATGTFVSVGYASFGGAEDIDLEGRMDGLLISPTVAVTTTTSSVQTTPSFAAKICEDETEIGSECIDRLHLYFTPDEDGDTKLHLAVISQNPDAVMYLVLAAVSYCKSALLNLQNFEFRQTALHLAVVTDQPAVVRLLVNCGASPAIRDRHGNTPLHLACRRGLVRCVVEMTRPFSDEEHAQLAQCCLNAGLPTPQLPAFRLPNPNTVDYEGHSCLHMVESWKSHPESASQRLPTIHYLVHNCHADINIQEGKSGYSLLHLAVKEEDAELFSYLLREPMVDVNRATYCRRTALDIADMLERYDMVRQLTAAGAQHSANYVPDSGSESDDMDEYDDLMIAGQKPTANSLW